MTLMQYKEAQGLTYEELAERIGCSPMTAHRACAGRRVSPEMAAAIERGTGGAVSAESIIASRLRAAREVA